MKIVRESINIFVFESLTNIKREADPDTIKKTSSNFRNFTSFMVLYLINYKNVDITHATDFVDWNEERIQELYNRNKSVKYIIDHLYKKIEWTRQN